MNPACLIWCFHTKSQSFMKRIGHESLITKFLQRLEPSWWIFQAAPRWQPQAWKSPQKKWIILEPPLWNHRFGTMFGNFYHPFFRESRILSPTLLMPWIGWWMWRGLSVLVKWPHSLCEKPRQFIPMAAETHSFSIRRIWLLCPNVYNPTVDTKIWRSKRWKKALAVGKKFDPIRLVPLSLTKDWSTWSTWYPGCNNMLSISVPWILSFPHGK